VETPRKRYQANFGNVARVLEKRLAGPEPIVAMHRRFNVTPAYGCEDLPDSREPILPPVVFPDPCACETNQKAFNDGP
jgi:hypothetical protein